VLGTGGTLSVIRRALAVRGECGMLLQFDIATDAIRARLHLDPLVIKDNNFLKE